jgi:hypothetical protein
MASAYTYTHFGGSPEWARRARLDRLDRLSRLLDVAFAVPGTNIRFGVEAILRLGPRFWRRGRIRFIVILRPLVSEFRGIFSFA